MSKLGSHWLRDRPSRQSVYVRLLKDIILLASGRTNDNIGTKAGNSQRLTSHEELPSRLIINYKFPYVFILLIKKIFLNLLISIILMK